VEAGEQARFMRPTPASPALEQRVLLEPVTATDESRPNAPEDVCPDTVCSTSPSRASTESPPREPGQTVLAA